MELDAHFGSFRQLLHATSRAPRDLARLRLLVDFALSLDPARYHEQWVGYADSLLDKHPPVVLECRSVPEFLHWSERAPFARFDVRFDRELRGKAALDALARAPRLDLVRALSIDACRIGASGAAALAKLDGLTGLTSLDLNFGYINDDGLRALIDSGLVARLDELHLSSCSLSAAGARMLADARPTLTHLDLSSNRFGTAGYHTVVSATSGLRWLRVMEETDDEGGVFDVDSLARFVALENLEQVELLDLFCSTFCDLDTVEFARVFAGSPYLTNLRFLTMGGYAYDSDMEAARILFESESLPSLETLPSYFFGRVSPEETCAAVLATPRAQSLAHLDVRRTSYHFVPALVAAEPLAALTSLSMAGHCDEDFDALAAWPGLANIRSLDLGRVGGYEDSFTVDDLDELIASPFIEGLRELVLPRGLNYYAFFEPFASSPALEGLESLTLHDAYIDWPREIRMLFESPLASSLQRLDLSHCTLATSGWDAICQCSNLSAMRHLLIPNARLLPRHLKSVRSRPWFERLETLDLTIPYPTSTTLWHTEVSSKSPAREELPDELRELVDRAESFVVILAHSRLPEGLVDLRINVRDHLGEPLAPDSLARLIGHPNLPHDARHRLASVFTKKQLNGLARELGLAGANRLKRYPLVESMRRFVVASDADAE